MNGSTSFTKSIFTFCPLVSKLLRCRIGIPYEDVESNDAVILGFMVAVFLRHFRDAVTAYQPLVVAQFHEWQAGVGLLMARLWKLDIATVYTTHATLLGRHLCAGGCDLYNNLGNFNLDEEAGKRRVSLFTLITVRFMDGKSIVDYQIISDLSSVLLGTGSMYIGSYFYYSFGNYWP